MAGGARGRPASPLTARGRSGQANALLAHGRFGAPAPCPRPARRRPSLPAYGQTGAVASRPRPAKRRCWCRCSSPAANSSPQLLKSRTRAVPLLWFPTGACCDLIGWKLLARYCAPEGLIPSMASSPPSPLPLLSSRVCD
ncbi:hypothetical protein C2845_PM02G15730 [Panicum miliaceum]|uniref:Uncharacterized protein n=1 Tax=Panicum miliaceum TaxID=4540 RepID=A0A3L6S5T0_PANMI|nr:hypothetical protein C2845_PM02G15730 [Panicum miliaceum]